MSYEEQAPKIEKHPTGWIFAVMLGMCLSFMAAIGVMWKTDRNDQRERLQDITKQLSASAETIKQMAANEAAANKRRDSLEAANRRITEELTKFLNTKNKARK